LASRDRAGGRQSRKGRESPSRPPQKSRSDFWGPRSLSRGAFPGHAPSGVLRPVPGARRPRGGGPSLCGSLPKTQGAGQGRGETEAVHARGQRSPAVAARAGVRAQADRQDARPHCLPRGGGQELLQRCLPAGGPGGGGTALGHHGGGLFPGPPGGRPREKLRQGTVRHRGPPPSRGSPEAPGVDPVAVGGMGRKHRAGDGPAGTLAACVATSSRAAVPFLLGVLRLARQYGTQRALSGLSRRTLSGG